MSGIRANESGTTPPEESFALVSYSPTTSNYRHEEAGYHNREEAGDHALAQAVEAVTTTTLVTPESQMPDNMTTPVDATDTAGSGQQVAAKYLVTERHHPVNSKKGRVGHLINTYLISNSDEYSRLTNLRELGWKNPAGDIFFQKQRHNADNADDKMSMIFYDTMRHIGIEMQKKTGTLVIDKSAIISPHILDMCCAPGGFLTTSMDINPSAQALSFSLPASEGGHKMPFSPPPNLELRFLDLTMLAADMGVTEIPTEHPDAENFLPRQFSPDKLFSLVICDGQVLRPNVHKRATYRQNREACRLTVTQFALGLEHVQPGGTMVVLLIRVEMSYTMCCVYKFTKFSSVQVFKPVKHHAKRSSFYMVATNVQSRHPEAVLAIQFWKEQWTLATFGSDEEYEEDVLEHWAESEKVIGVFGEELVKLGMEVWDIQAKALSRAPFIKNQIASTGI